eukprot:1971523-Prymnesium_polylepis.1
MNRKGVQCHRGRFVRSQWAHMERMGCGDSYGATLGAILTSYEHTGLVTAVSAPPRDPVPGHK